MLALTSLAAITALWLSVVDISCRSGLGVAAKRSKPLISKQCSLETAPLQANFNVTAYMGKWYEVYFKFSNEEQAEDKFYTDYFEKFELIEGQTTEADAEKGTVLFNSYYSGRHNDKCIFGRGATYASKPSAPAKHVANRRFNDTARHDVEYWVLGTDYTRYTVVYGCVKAVAGQDGRHVCADDHAWVFSRTRNLTDPDVLDIVKTLVSDVCMDFSEDFTEHSQNSPPCAGALSAMTSQDFRPIVLGLFASILGLKLWL